MTRCTHCGGPHPTEAHTDPGAAALEGVRALWRDVRGQRDGAGAEMWLAQARVLWRREGRRAR